MVLFLTLKKNNMEEKKAVKNYTKFPIEAIKYFKTKDLYLLAGLYLQ
jgi:hypothetical protein